MIIDLVSSSRDVHGMRGTRGSSQMLYLPCLSVHSVAAAEPAEFLQFESILGVRLVLGCDVVPPLALGTGKRQRRSLVAWHC